MCLWLWMGSIQAWILHLRRNGLQIAGLEDHYYPKSLMSTLAATWWTGTIGSLLCYLGKNETHADWFISKLESIATKKSLLLISMKSKIYVEGLWWWWEFWLFWMAEPIYLRVWRQEWFKRPTTIDRTVIGIFLIIWISARSYLPIVLQTDCPVEQIKKKLILQESDQTRVM